jgi:hypothetical protein
MPRLTANVASALADWWTLALDAGFKGYRSTDLVSAARDIAEQNGRTLSFSEGTALASLFGYARRMYNAGQEVQNAGEDDYIESKHIATPPWARDVNAQNANPIWHVTYELSTMDEEGNVSTSFKTSVFEGPNMPDTIGELNDAIEEDAHALSSKYEVAYVDHNVTQILAV